MDLDRLAQLLNEAIQFLPQPQELTLFSVGGRGYFENPTTDLLAFFFDPNQPHGFKDLLLRSFLRCMALEVPNPLELSEPPQREEITSGKNRLDLLLISENWILAIENKIWHAQQNPFEDYERHLKTRFREKKIYMAILSPLGTSTHPSWTPVSYKRFIVEVIMQLGTFSIQTKFTKWFVFLREFLIHLENEATERAMEDKQVEFVEKNYTTISQLIELRKKYHKIIEQKGRSVLEELFPQSLISIKVHSWPHGPAVRFHLNRWRGESDIVIYINGSTDESGMWVQMYASDIPRAEAIPPDAIATGLISWSEGNWRCWRTNEKWFDHGSLLQHFRELASRFDKFLQARQSTDPTLEP